MRIGQERIIAVIISLAYIPAYALGVSSIWVACMAISAACLYSRQLGEFLGQVSPNEKLDRRRFIRFLRLLSLQITAIASLVLISMTLAVEFNIIQLPSGSASLNEFDRQVCVVISRVIGGDAVCYDLDLLRTSLVHAFGLAALIPVAHWFFGASEIRRAAALLCNYSVCSPGSETHCSYFGKGRFAQTAVLIFLAGWSISRAFSSSSVDPIACAVLELGLIYFAQIIAISFCESIALLQRSM